MHFPEVCLPAVGSVFIRQAPNAILTIRGGELSFRVSEFLARGRKVFVFFCLREEANRERPEDDLLQDWSPRSRIQRAWAGQRNLGQESIALVVTGADDSADAQRAVAVRLPELVSLEASTEEHAR
jgi:hypothetical protein